MALKRPYVRIAEAALGYALPTGAVVHHVDENRRNNRNDNLVILQSQAEHNALHRRLRILKAGGDPWRQQICCTCQKVKDLTDFPAHTPYSAVRYRTPRLGECRECKRERDVLAHARKTGRLRRETAEERSIRGREMAYRRWRKPCQSTFTDAQLATSLSSALS